MFSVKIYHEETYDEYIFRAMNQRKLFLTINYINVEIS